MKPHVFAFLPVVSLMLVCACTAAQSRWRMVNVTDSIEPRRVDNTACSDSVLPQEAPVRQRTSFNTVFAQAEYVSPGFSIDHAVPIMGEEVHFFTSRPMHYLGWSFKCTYEVPKTDHFGYGYLFGMGYWKTGFWLNWELPSLSLSVDPMTSTLGCFHADPGFLLYYRVLFLRIVPYVAIPVGLSTFSLINEGNKEEGNAFYCALDGGVRADLALVADLHLAFGYEIGIPLNSNPSFNVEEGVQLVGGYDKPPQQFFVAILYEIE